MAQKKEEVDFVEAGREGGNITMLKHGKEHYQRIGRLGRQRQLERAAAQKKTQTEAGGDDAPEPSKVAPAARGTRRKAVIPVVQDGADPLSGVM